jgi:hypothetical protein
MDQFTALLTALSQYRPQVPDLLRYLRFERKYHGDQFCLNYQDDLLEYVYQEFFGSLLTEVPRDEEDNILVEEALSWGQTELDDIYVRGQLAPFVRTMKRTQVFKEELMQNVWHPRRIEKLLEIGGEEALDNFAGV